jgi:hypothetical protein
MSCNARAQTLAPRAFGYAVVAPAAFPILDP